MYAKMMIAAFGAAALLMGTGLAMAQTYWTNPGAGDWFNAANWTSGVPTSGLAGQP
jgi:hypothetical protein